MTRKLVIDTDTASDDAVALIMALRWPEVEVAAITVVSGNVPVEQGVINALYTVELCGSNVPVYRGAARPLVREPVLAQFFHGEDGLGNQHYPPPSDQPADGHAVEVLIETIKANPGATLVTLGPLTNIALAVAQAPEIIANVERCVVMGGAANAVGNITPAAEYNIWVDPEAARLVFQSGMPIEMAGWELCRGDANLNDDDIAYIRSLGTACAHFTIDCNLTALQANREWLGDPGIALPDPVAMAIALDPTICTRRSTHYVEVETQSDLTRGMTVVDALDVMGDPRNGVDWGPLVAREPTVRVCWAIDVKRWKDALFSVLK